MDPEKTSLLAERTLGLSLFCYFDCDFRNMRSLKVADIQKLLGAKENINS